MNSWILTQTYNKYNPLHQFRLVAPLSANPLCTNYSIYLHHIPKASTRKPSTIVELEFLTLHIIESKSGTKLRPSFPSSN